MRSDHIPILLCSNAVTTSPRPFKFELMWLEVPSFKIKKWWEGFVVEGTACFRFGQKLKLLKDCIVRWKEEFWGLEKKKLFYLAKMETLDRKGMIDGLEKVENEERKEAEKDYNHLLKMEEIS